MDDNPVGPSEETPKPIGRPTKAELKAKSPGGRGKRGRPKGDAAIINEYKARMLRSPKSKKVMAAIFDAALDNEHKHQAVAWKLIMGRIAPAAAFEDEVVKNAKGNHITISISGVPSVKVGNEEVEGEFEEIQDDPNGEEGG